VTGRERLRSLKVERKLEMHGAAMIAVLLVHDLRMASE
jgi:hypothetical protein